MMAVPVLILFERNVWLRTLAVEAAICFGFWAFVVWTLWVTIAALIAVLP